jgi:hypothetical protein
LVFLILSLISLLKQRTYISNMFKVLKSETQEA